jgi:hypothetical protein
MTPADSYEDRQETNEPTLVDSAWQRIKNRLEDERHRIYEEIKNYPTPITACDVQFGHLLEQQAGVFAELARLHEARELGLQSGDWTKTLDEFLESSRFMDDETKAQLRSSLKEPF